jgi:hypothetical protein
MSIVTRPSEQKNLSIKYMQKKLSMEHFCTEWGFGSFIKIGRIPRVNSGLTKSDVFLYKISRTHLVPWYIPSC